METKTKSVLTYFNKIEVLCIINYFDLIHRLHDIKERNVELHEKFFFWMHSKSYMWNVLNLPINFKQIYLYEYHFILIIKNKLILEYS